MKTMKLLTLALIAVCGLSIISCNPAADAPKNNEIMTQKAPYKKKYTNADFYKDGKLDPKVALAAYMDMFEYYGIPFNDFMKENFWITDFELGDLENVGMGGIFWVNDMEHSYFGHEIYLLPSQMIAEHRHMPTEHPAKFESWLVRDGMVYNYSIGDPTPNPPALPASQKDFITVSHFVKQYPSEVVHLAEVESQHFLLAGPEGAVVTEFANFHDGNGLRFTNKNVIFTDVLTKEQ